MTRLAVLDGDILLWLTAYHDKDIGNEYNMLSFLDKYIQDILVATKADRYVGYLQGADNSHRHKMFSDYKATRPPKPDWVKDKSDSIKRHLVDTWGFKYAMGEETDDCIASVVEACRGTDTVAIVCSSDKDFNQLATEIYNPRHKETKIVSELEAETNLAKQILMGDMTDNIRGLSGIGPKKAEEALTEGFRLSGMSPLHIALEVYTAFYGGLQGLIEFSQTAIKITLKRDKLFSFTPIEVPTGVRVALGHSTDLF